MKPLFQTNLNQLIKISSLTQASQKMNGTLVILHGDELQKLKQVNHHLGEAIRLLSEIK